MKMGAFILAAQQLDEKWGSKVQRHLVPIAGEPLIERTLRQLRVLSCSSFVVTGLEELRVALPTERMLVPKKCGQWIDTFLSTRAAWDEFDEVAILQGDVVWSDSTMAWMLAHEGSPMFFGAPIGVVDAITFEKKDFVLVMEKAEEVAVKHRSASCSGLLREFCARKPVGCVHYAKRPLDHTTCDFDGYAHYLRYVAARKWAQIPEKELQSRVDALRPWHYCHAFPHGIMTGSYKKESLGGKMSRLLAAGAFSEPVYSRVLDLGANSGIISMWFCKYRDSHVVAIEDGRRYYPQLELAVEAKGYLGRIEPVKADVCTHDLGEECFDLVLCLGLLHQVGEKKHPALLEACRRALVPGGEIVVQTRTATPVLSRLCAAGFGKVEKLYDKSGKSAWQGIK